MTSNLFASSRLIGLLGTVLLLLNATGLSALSTQQAQAQEPAIAGISVTSNGKRYSIRPGSQEGMATLVEIGPAPPRGYILGPNDTAFWIEREPIVWNDLGEPAAPQVWRIVQGKRDGSNGQVLLTSASFYAAQPPALRSNSAPNELTLSLDGKALYFDPCLRGINFIYCDGYRFNLQSKQISRLAFDGWGSVSIAPDGLRSFFTVPGNYCMGGGRFFHTYLSTPTGRITLGTGMPGDIFWLSDGRLLFSMIDDWTCDNRAETNRIRLSTSNGIKIRDLSLDVIAFEVIASPDEEYVAYIKGRYNATFDMIGKELWIVKMDGSGLRKITDLPLDTSDLHWEEIAPITYPNYQVSGRVTDRNGRGLEGVRITAGNKVATTDFSGNYTLRDMPEGQWTLVPSKPDSDVVFTPAAISINVQADSDTQNFSAACEKSPTTGLDSCALLPGDLLLVRGASTGVPDMIWAIELGSYFHHVGMYTGNQEVTEAVGFRDNDAEEVVTRPIEQTVWWSTDPILDWSVIRPKLPPNKQVVVGLAKDWAVADNPIIGYWFSGRFDDTSFYCSKLVWRAYQLTGYDIEQAVWQVWGWTPDPLVTPRDLYNNRSFLVQQMYNLVDYIPATIAVGSLASTVATRSDTQTADATTATILVIDSQGRRTGFDPATEIAVSEIPDAIYSGTDAQVQNVSVSAIGTGWTVQVTGVAGGSFRVVVDFPSVTPWQPQVIEGTVSPGETQTFTIIPPRRLYLPLVRR